MLRTIAMSMSMLILWTPASTLLAQDESTGSSWVESYLPESFQSQIFGLEQWQWLAIAALVVVAWILQKIVSHLAGAFFRTLISRLKDGERTSKVVASIGRSIGWFASAGVVHISGPSLALGPTGDDVIGVIARALATIGGLLLAYRLVDLVGARLEDSASKTDSKLDDQLAPMIRKSLKALVTVGAALFLIQSTGKDIMPLVTGLSVLGIGVSFAAKDTFANLFGSLTVFADRPFQLGDWVKVGGVEGTVEEIGFRCTRIRTFESSLVSVPNQELVSGIIDNMGQRDYRRFKTTIGVRYETPADTIEALCAGILKIVEANPDIEYESAKANLVNFGASSLDIMVNIRLRVADYFGELRAKQAFLLEVIRLAEEMGVGFAFPSTSLYLESTPENQYSLPPAASLDQLKQQIDRFGPGGELSRSSGSGEFPDQR
ncbi:MAG: mechanosensitive ion channel family protein [Planctomycetota bacterium]|nr:mechanosensitive ion channel family protein [Planctomycetota bacterium]